MHYYPKLHNYYYLYIQFLGLYKKLPILPIGDKLILAVGMLWDSEVLPSKKNRKF